MTIQFRTPREQIAGIQHRERVRREFDIIRRHRQEDDFCLQRRLGYKEGWRNGLLIGIGLSCGTAVVVYLLMLVVANG